MQTPPLLNLPKPPGFDQFWQAYPKKESKVTAEKAFSLAIRKTNLGVLLEALAAVKQTDQWRKGVIPLAASWLNQQRWEDTLTPTAPTTKELSPVQLQIHQSEYLRILEAMRVIKTAYCDHQTWTADDRSQFQVLKARRNELRKMLNILR